jgi:hypothetical protein
LNACNSSGLGVKSNFISPLPLSTQKYSINATEFGFSMSRTLFGTTCLSTLYGRLSCLSTCASLLDLLNYPFYQLSCFLVYS